MVLAILVVEALASESKFSVVVLRSHLHVPGTDIVKVLTLRNRREVVETATLVIGRFHLRPDAVFHLSFNDHAWMVVFSYPDFFGNLSKIPRKRPMDILIKFVQLSEEERGEESAVSNEYNAVFWSGELENKASCADCPYLDSTYNETPRVHNGAGALRVVTEEKMIGGKRLLPGNNILISFRQLHSNEQVWGQTVDEFRPYRFMQQKSGSLARHPSFRPFGGGGTFCLGRMLAKEEVFGFLATFLRRFDL
ncbi:cytochrome P450 [Xylariomycetidae sp. FL2044]|nr:cytochrome P450 [Xylariomycetidae sp. FL2044]